MATPSPSTPLSTAINTATRPLHTRLNHLITARLPLALPPHAESPAVYAKGLRAFAHVFFAFEERWAALRTAKVEREESWVNVVGYADVLARRQRMGQEGGRGLNDSGEGEGVEEKREAHGAVGEGEDGDWASNSNVRVSNEHENSVRIVAELLPPGLMRTARLEQDLRNLGVGQVRGEKRTEQKVEEFMARIREQVEERPWVLVAYAWVMYMAIFSGGRWIRQQLRDAGPKFWSAEGEERGGEEWKGLSFLCFDGEYDGEDIKAEFKQRLVDAEGTFDEDQRHDIIQEAKAIFTYCISIVGELDETLRETGVQEDPETLDYTRSAKQARQAVEADPSNYRLRQRNIGKRSPLSAHVFTGVAVVIGCVSWYAYYFASVGNAQLGFNK